MEFLSYIFPCTVQSIVTKNELKLVVMMSDGLL